MASFDIVCQIDLQEVDNAVNGVLRELTNRYDLPETLIISKKVRA